MQRPLALIVDSDAAVRAQLHQLLERCDVDSVGAANGEEASAILRSRDVRLVLADPRSRGVDPAALVRDATRPDSPAAWIALSRDGTASTDPDAVAVIPLPAEHEVFAGALERARRDVDLIERVRSLERRLQQRAGFRGFVGRSAASERLRERASRLAATQDPLVLWGESGSGRRTLARLIHDGGPHADGPFVVGGEAVGSGDERDDRSEPVSMRRALESARGGTLLLEGLGRSPAARQQAWADSLAAARGVRTIAVLDDDPDALVGHGRLLPVLAERLATVSLHVPPLRERREDIPLLAQAFVDGVREINRLPEISLERETLEAIERHAWPENVRELRNAIERAVILSRDGRIRAVDLPEAVREARPAAEQAVSATRAFRDAKRVVVERFERGYLTDLMRRHSGNVTAASHQAGMLRSALQRLLRKYSIKSAEFRVKGRRRRGGESRIAAD